VVQPYDQDGYKWRLLAGHRRFKAVTIFLKWSEIPASVRYNLTLHQARLLNLTENLERKDLNMMEEARAIRNLYPEGVSLRTAAEELKKPTRWIHARLRLLELPEEVQKKAAAGILSAVNIEAIAKLATIEEQIKAAQEISKAKEKGKTKFLDVDARYKRRFRDRRSKEQIGQMIKVMFDAGIEGLPTRALAWAAGYVSDEELQMEIKQYAPEHGTSSS
jgi:ParB/RepB/Spo0J family partition protein